MNKMKYEVYAWIGLAGIILSLLAGILSNFSPLAFGFLILLSTVASLIFRWAFVEISKKTKNTTLLVGTSSLLVLNVLSFLFYIYFLFSPLQGKFPTQPGAMQLMMFSMLTFFVIAFLIMGAFLIVTGIGYLRLKKFGGLATATGVLHIITGSLFITFILAFLGVFTMLAAWILEVIILFKADKLIK